MPFYGDHVFSLNPMITVFITIDLVPKDILIRDA
jgi:hypothetical protein